MRGTTVVICALAACGGKTAAPEHHLAPAKWCIDPVAPGGTTIALEREGDASVLESPRDLGEGRVAVAEVDEGVAIALNADCGETPCSPEIVGIGDGGKVAARAALPHTDELQPTAGLPFTVSWLSVADVDGDGAPEAWVSYGITSPPEAAVGSTTTQYLAMFSLPDLTTRFVAPIGTYPEASSLDRCDGTLALVDADCDGQPDLVVGQTCAPAVCAEDPEEEPDLCGQPAPPTATVYRRGADGAYTAVTPGA